MMELNRTSIKDFSKAINANPETIQNLLSDCQSCSYVNEPLKAIAKKVGNIENSELVIEYIYCNIYNRPRHRFYTTKGYSITLI